MSEKKKDGGDLNISVNRDVQGDLIAGDQITNIGGDQVTIVNNYYEGSPEQPAAPTGPKPRIAYEPETVEIEAGPFQMGHDGDVAPELEKPAHSVELKTYWISKYPITNAEYAEYLRQTKQQPPNSPDWFLAEPVKEKVDHPVVSITWDEALAYCHWLSEYTGQTYRLPTEAQWEKAAGGPRGMLYPWGNDWLPGAAHVEAEETVSVKQYAHVPNHYGIVSMVGNVQEWTRTQWGTNRKEPEYRYPYVPNDGRNVEDDIPKMRRIYRGAAYKDSTDKASNKARRSAPQSGATAFRGFRVVLELEG